MLLLAFVQLLWIQGWDTPRSDLLFHAAKIEELNGFVLRGTHFYGVRNVKPSRSNTSVYTRPSFVRSGAGFILGPAAQEETAFVSVRLRSLRQTGHADRWNHSQAHGRRRAASGKLGNILGKVRGIDRRQAADYISAASRNDPRALRNLASPSALDRPVGADRQQVSRLDPNCDGSRGKTLGYAIAAQARTAATTQGRQRSKALSSQRTIRCPDVIRCSAPLAIGKDPRLANRDLVAMRLDSLPDLRIPSPRATSLRTGQETTHVGEHLARGRDAESTERRSQRAWLALLHTAQDGSIQIRANLPTAHSVHPSGDRSIERGTAHRYRSTLQNASGSTKFLPSLVPTACPGRCQTQDRGRQVPALPFTKDLCDVSESAQERASNGRLPLGGFTRRIAGGSGRDGPLHRGRHAAPRATHGPMA